MLILYKYMNTVKDLNILKHLFLNVFMNNN
jgi:hypothetical protein